MNDSPKVFILLLNYRGTNDTLACLDFLRQLRYPHMEVVVIDNASPDNSVERLQARLRENPGEFHFIESHRNLGYSGGNNLGIDYALAQSKTGTEAYVWLLNNDTTVHPDALTALVQESQKTGGLAGSLLLYPDGAYQQVGTKIRWLTGSVKGYSEREIYDGMSLETLTGASMLIPFHVIRAVGKLDESFFLYFEDGEYSLRCAQAGYSLTLAKDSIVFHIEGASTGRKSLPTQYYFHRNRLKLLWMYATPLQKVTIGFYTTFRLLRAIVKSYSIVNAERRHQAQASLKVHWRALSDFCRGTDGSCPHNLEHLR